ncbi:MAG: hypothetical protein ACRERS_05685 [Methylococcales bacterium]
MSESHKSSRERIYDRRADLIVRVTTIGGDRLILHGEIQGGNQAKMAVRLLRYLTDFPPPQ